MENVADGAHLPFTIYHLPSHKGDPMPFTLQLGQPAPDFSLPGIDGKTYSPASFKDAKLLAVVFSCNHCPYVLGSEDRMTAFARRYAQQGVAFVAINSNEADNHPTDSFDHMVRRAADEGLPFPHLRDDSQDMARRS